MLAPIIVLVVLLIALGAAVWYFFTHFTLAPEPSVPAGGSSISQSAAAGSTAPAGQSMSLGEDGAYHPFG